MLADNMSTRILVRHLWEVGLLLQALLAVTLLAKQNSKRFPFFAAYSFFCFVESAVLYGLWFAGTQYISPRRSVQGFWIAEIISLMLGFGVIYEIFRKLFSSYSALRALANRLFQWASVALAFMGFLVIYFQVLSPYGPVVDAMYVVEEATRTIEVGLLLFLFLFANAFGLHWRQSVFGIALGFGIFISVELIAVTMKLQFSGTFNIVRSIAFDTSLLLWLGYLLAPESATQRTDVPKLSQLEQWNQALMELIHQ